MEYFEDPAFVTLFGAVLLVRFVLPFTVLRWPLPGIVACLIVDGIDQTVFQWFGYDPPFYQSYDKAMDVFYLGIAYIATLRNWTNLASFAVSRFLFFYRQIGVVLFEVTHVRALLLVFPNTFEYFFIAYEAIRARWAVRRLAMRDWVIIAAVIWIFVKLPQEYWIHVAQLDFTDTLQDVPWFGPAIVLALVVAGAVFWFAIRPRLAPADHGWQFAAPPLPVEIDTATERAAFVAEHERIWSWASLEKSLLIGLLGVIFAMILPEAPNAPLRMVLWTAVFVLVNVAVTLAFARRGWSSEAILRGFALRFIGNFALLVLIAEVLYPPLMIRHAWFFILLFCVLVTTYDRYRPVYAWRLHAARAQQAD